MFAGYKTYAVAAAVALATAAYQLGYLAPIQYEAILGLLGAGGLAALRSAITRR